MFELTKKGFHTPMGTFGSFFDDLFSPLTKTAFKVDISETEDVVTLKAELPGIKKDDISVDYSDRVLSIKATKKESSEESGEKFLRKESYYGSMERSFRIGAIDPENIKASYSDGILSIQLKREVEEPMKKIEIT